MMPMSVSIVNAALGVVPAATSHQFLETYSNARLTPDENTGAVRTAPPRNMNFLFWLENVCTFSPFHSTGDTGPLNRLLVSRSQNVSGMNLSKSLGMFAAVRAVSLPDAVNVCSFRKIFHA